MILPGPQGGQLPPAVGWQPGAGAGEVWQRHSIFQCLGNCRMPRHMLF